MCVLLWAQPGQEAALTQYEDDVLTLLSDHGGRVRLRLLTGRREGYPDEVQFLEFASQAGVDAYVQDPRRTALAAVRTATIAHTNIVPLAEPLPPHPLLSDRLGRSGMRR